MQIVCDKCSHEYGLTKDHIKFTEFEEIDVEYLECPECGSKFIIACKDSYSRREYKKFMKRNASGTKARKKSLIRMKRHSNKLKLDVVSKSQMFMEKSQLHNEGEVICVNRAKK